MCIKKHFYLIRFDELENSPCLVFRYLFKRGPLRWSNNCPPVRYIPSYLDQLNHAVAIMHRKGVVHIDLLPSNIM